MTTASTSSTDPRGSEAVGRTGWDFLNSKFIPLLAFIGIIVLMVLMAANPGLSDQLGELWDAALPYVVPLVLGWLFGRHLYNRYLRQIVIVQVEDLEHNVQSEFEVSRVRFESLKVSDGILNPVSTLAGVPLYRFVDFDPMTMTGRSAWVHDPRSDLASVLLVRSRWESLVKHDLDMTMRAEELAVLGHQETYEHAQELSNSLLDSLELRSVSYDCETETEPETSEVVL